MTDFLPAIVSAVLWAVSAPIVNAGIRNLPDQNRLFALMLGMAGALACGAAGLGLAVAVAGQGIGEAIRLAANPYVALAGLFTFPIATGLYYLAGEAFGGRTEIASQFAKVKPVFSVLLAAWVLGESLNLVSWAAFALILAGVLVLLSGARSGAFSPRALGIGMTCAAAWALGEMFVKLGFEEGASLEASFAALVASLPFAALAGGAALFRIRLGAADFKWLLPFCVHGLISFAAAYTLFFSSIARVGMADTVLVTAFWPLLAIGASCATERLQGRACIVHRVVLLAAALLLIGSMLKILTS